MSSQFVLLQQCNYPYLLTDVTIGFQSQHYTGVEGGVVHVVVAVIEGRLARPILVNIYSQDESRLLCNHSLLFGMTSYKGLVPNLLTHSANTRGFLVLSTSCTIKLTGLLAIL